jgi:hypothetical protein
MYVAHELNFQLLYDTVGGQHFDIFGLLSTRAQESVARALENSY